MSRGGGWHVELDSAEVEGIASESTSCIPFEPLSWCADPHPLCPILAPHCTEGNMHVAIGAPSYSAVALLIFG